ncbi:peptide chain release factor N(5)-glutamine methyltransferase [Propionibacteriaceae bacterium Y1923]|uniref:peptide chain release factor N(5)-glutamine methyltransferase n=1 Tax=Aestuariimicrobium sp. Y1814 TaxID=3418742 RepID=UPI003C1BE558
MNRPPVHVAIALNWARAQLEAAGVASPSAEARTLLAHAAGVGLGELVLMTRLAPEAGERFADLVDRRAAGTPVQHLTGVAHFRTVGVAVGPGVFIPRPETEVMVGWALEAIAGLASPVVVELCTGSGAIARALAAEAPQASIHAVELDPPAARYAERNLFGTGVDLRVGDMADAFGDLDGTVDLVISNPPYIPLEAWESVQAEVRDFDPGAALFSGPDGLDAMRVVARVAARLLVPGGVVAAEHAEVQHDSAQQVFLDHGGFTGVRDHQDLTRRWRFVTATRI